MHQKVPHLYARMSTEDHKRLWRRLLQKYRSIQKIAERFGLSVRQLYKWKEGVSAYPLESLEELCGDLGMPIQKLEFIKTTKASDLLKDPVFNPDPTEIVEFLGHLLFDGGIDKKHNVHYTTHSKLLAKRFRYLLKRCFGTIVVREKTFGRRVTLYTSVVIGKILEAGYKVKIGSKVKNDVGIPEVVMRTKNAEIIWRFISAAYICDGIRERTAIAIASNDLDSPPRLLEDTKRLLEKLGFKSVEIKGSNVYKTKDGMHRRWVLRIFDKNEKAHFRRNVGTYIAAVGTEHPP